MQAMLSYIREQTVAITIGVSFFVFGFFIMANLLNLTERDVLIGLISGAIGGATMLVVSRLEHDPEAARSGLDPAWKPAFGKPALRLDPTDPARH